MQIKVIIQRRVRKWILEATIISAELEKCIRMEKLMSSAASGATRKSASARKNSVSASDNHSVFGDVEWTNRTEVVLEFVQARNRLTQRSKLILPLFKLLKTYVNIRLACIPKLKFIPNNENSIVFQMHRPRGAVARGVSEAVNSYDAHSLLLRRGRSR